MSIVIDVIILAIILLTAYISSKYGFVRTAIELVGFVLIVLIVNNVSTPIANTVYDYVIEKEVTDKYKVSESGSLSADEFIRSLPKYITKDNGILSVDKEEIKTSFEKSMSLGREKAVKKVSDVIIKPVVVKVISLLISAILFMLLSVLVHFIARILNGAVKHTFAKGLNEKLGFIIGIPKGLIIALIIMLLLLLYFKIISDNLWLFSKDDVYDSFTVKLLVRFLPKTGILKYLI